MKEIGTIADNFIPLDIIVIAMTTVVALDRATDFVVAHLCGDLDVPDLNRETERKMRINHRREMINHP